MNTTEERIASLTSAQSGIKTAEIDLQNLMRRLPDTTSFMYEENRYKEYTKDELIELSKG